MPPETTGPSDLEAQAERLLNDSLLDAVGLAADAAGIADPSPISDSVGLGVAIAQRDLAGSLLSVASMFPYLGDLVAKPFKMVPAVARLVERLKTLMKMLPDLQKLGGSAAQLAAKIRAELGKYAGKFCQLPGAAALCKLLNELNQKPRSPELYSEPVDGPPMDAARFRRMKEAFERQGGMIDQSDAALHYIESRGVSAVTFNDKTILLKPNPTASEVFEEFIHVGQHRRREIDSSTTIDMEIEAAEKLIRHRKAYGITNHETKQTISRLRRLRKARR